MNQRTDAAALEAPPFRGTAAGKVILLGEHAVVYGSPALVVGLDRGAEAEVHPALHSTLVLGTQSYALDSVAGSEPLPAQAFRALLGALGAPGVAARAQLALPAGAGLGASAALGVALARAVVQLLAAQGSPALPVAPAALAWEQVFHGNASGVDTAAAELAGCLRFRRGETPVALRPAQPLQLVITQAEAGASTRLMVAGVAARREAEPERSDALLTQIATLVARAQACIERGELAELGQLMTQNHELLSQLGVSTPGLDQAVREALGSGALGAKLTGAGGGGCVVALVEEARATSVLQAWQARGLPCWEKRVA
jgi:mevalonate kinase